VILEDVVVINKEQQRFNNLSLSRKNVERENNRYVNNGIKTLSESIANEWQDNVISELKSIWGIK
jgi:hypothetical protein